ncbi:MAG: sulfite exporter TauE/SafE family protein [Clostridiales Family XIII bacterium]|jgi:sulfite exporter TauE/SafE/copper chaperone CopZ|nr:sulfite exporter TauE/SafE family protein [Clostridiales Family XIII bacterium]
MAMKEETLYIGGMTCTACPGRVERGLGAAEGVEFVRADYASGSAFVRYDDGTIGRKKFASLLQKAGYRLLDAREKRVDGRQLAGIIIIVVCVWLFVSALGGSTATGLFPVAKEGMTYGALFLLGLLTSVHCIGMCGGIGLSQCIPAAAKMPGAAGVKAEGKNAMPAAASSEEPAKSVRARGSARAALLPSFLYNAGRIASYTAVGALVGALGSVLVLGGALRGLVQIIAGVFMILMALNMLGALPFLSRFTPRLPKGLAARLDARTRGAKSPLIVGLLNGLMPCGPLQAMQLFALQTGSPGKGAFSMFLFACGTVPLMFGLGALSGLLSAKFTKRVMTIGAALVLCLGLFMLSGGWTLSGLPDPLANPGSGFAQKGGGTETENVGIMESDGSQTVYSTLQPGRYPDITVKAGVPVKWRVDAPAGSLSGCNYAIVIPEYNVEYAFSEGENLVEFTPAEPGTFTYTCWMGMIRGTIRVV